MDGIPVLETKLHAPRRRREVVARPRLDTRGRLVDLPALTLLSAPAGFGKTTLLIEWLSEWRAAGGAVAWLSLDRRDDDPVRFWSYVAAALGTVAPDVGSRAAAAARSAPSETVAATVLNDLVALDDEVVLVLDDLHLVESREVHDSLVFLLEHLPPHVHLVVGTRSDPPWPLASMRARGDLREVRAADLRFTATEAGTYLATMGLDLDGRHVATLEDRTEGWIAALQLAALSLQGRDDPVGFIEGFAGDDRFVLDYLVGEVLDRQPPETRSFLLQTSILHRLSGSLCDAITGGADGRATLEALDRANLFVVPLDDRRVWYRYHHLFADVLRARLVDEQPDVVPHLHQRACEWHEQHGDRPEAIRHALAAEDHDRAAELVELALPALRRERQEATFRPWLEALPPEVLRDRPVLTMGLVGARMQTGDIADVEPLLADVEQWLEGGGPTEGEAIVADHDELLRLPAQVAMHRTALALLAGDLPGTIAHAERTRSVTAADDHLAHGAASALLGLAHWSQGDLETAARRYREAIERLDRAGHHADILGCARALADMEVAQGRLGAAARTLEAALDRARRHGPLRGTADVHVGLSEIAWARDDVAAAAEHLDAAAELGEHLALPPYAHRSRVARARLLLVAGDTAGALDLLEEAAEVYDTDFSPPVQPVPAVIARVRLAEGDRDAVLAWAERTGLTPDDELSYVREYEHLTLARALPRPVTLLDRLLAAAEAGGRGSVVEILVVRARAHDAAGDSDAAIADLRRALHQAEPEGVVRVFLDEGAPVAALLGRVAATGGEGSAWARHLLDAGRTPVVDRVTSSGAGVLVEDLSRRELDVLRLLRSDLSGPDIARELVVSLNTVRTHTKNIYAKLGVSSRRAAVRRAAELGL